MADFPRLLNCTQTHEGPQIGSSEMKTAEGNNTDRRDTSNRIVKDSGPQLHDPVIEHSPAQLQKGR